MKRFLSLFAVLFCTVSVPALPPTIQPNRATTNAVPPYGQTYSLNKSQDFLVPVSIASNSAMMYNLVTNALSGSTVTLAAGTYDITNNPLVIPNGVTLQGVGTNQTIVRNWILADLHVAGQGCGIVPTLNCTIQYLQITNCVPTHFQGCIGSIYPQATCSNTVTRGLLTFGESDGIDVNQSTGSIGLWTDYGSTFNGKWDCIVFILGDGGADASMAFHAYGTRCFSTGPSVTVGYTGNNHAFYANADVADIILDGVTLSSVGATANNYSWFLDNGVFESDMTGSVMFRNLTTVGKASNVTISFVPTTNTFLLSLDQSSRNGESLTNIPGSGLQNPLAVTTINAVNLSLSGPILGTVQTNTGAIKASEFVGDGSKLTGVVAATGAIASTNGFGTNTTFYSTGPPAITANPAPGSQGSNYMGGITVITNLARTIQTNFISGLPYTNFTPTSQFVSYKFIATVAASAGDNAIASLSLIDPSEGYTVFTSISDGGETTTALSIARVVHFTVSGFVPSGAYYTFTNQCTGANTGTFVSGSGRLTQF